MSLYVMYVISVFDVSNEALKKTYFKCIIKCFKK